MDPGDAEDPHRPLDTLAVDPAARVAQLGRDPWGPLGAVVLGVDPPPRPCPARQGVLATSNRRQAALEACSGPAPARRRFLPSGGRCRMPGPGIPVPGRACQPRDSRARQGRSPRAVHVDPDAACQAGGPVPPGRLPPGTGGSLSIRGGAPRAAERLLPHRAGPGRTGPSMPTRPRPAAPSSRCRSARRPAADARRRSRGPARSAL